MVAPTRRPRFLVERFAATFLFPAFFLPPFFATFFLRVAMVSPLISRQYCQFHYDTRPLG
jgi:hypothetical protein